MHVIDLVDNCGKHEASRPVPAVLSDQATFAVVVRLRSTDGLAPMAFCCCGLSLRTPWTRLLV